MKKLLYTFLAVSIIFSACEKNEIGTYQVSVTTTSIEGRYKYTEGVLETIINTKTGEIVSYWTIKKSGFSSLYRNPFLSSSTEAGTYQTATTTGQDELKLYKKTIYQTTINTKTGQVVNRSGVKANNNRIDRDFQRYLENIKKIKQEIKEEAVSEATPVESSPAAEADPGAAAAD